MPALTLFELYKSRSFIAGVAKAFQHPQCKKAVKAGVSKPLNVPNGVCSDI